MAVCSNLFETFSAFSGRNWKKVSPLKPSLRVSKGNDLGRRNISQVDIRAEMLDKPNLLGFQRSFPDDLLNVDLAEDLIDQRHMGLAGRPVNTHIAAFPGLAYNFETSLPAIPSASFRSICLGK